MPTTRRWTPRCSPKPSASRCACNICATKAPAGIRRVRPRSITRAPRSMPRAMSSPTTSSARASPASMSTPTAASRSTRLAGQTLGVALKSGDGFGVPAESYRFANKRTAWETIPPLLDRASPLRSSHLRDPVGPQIHFASESFMDEVAAALNVDAVEFRLRYVKDARDIAVIKAAAEKAGWQTQAVAAQGPDRRQGLRPRHRLCAAQRHTGRHGRRGRYRSPQRQDLGAQVHRRPRLRPDHQSGRHRAWRSRATSCRASAARCGKR